MVINKARESNIELLRILTMLGVIILHYNNPTIGGAILYASSNTINLQIVYFLEGISACAVDLYILIFGFFMCKKEKVSVIKPLQLIIQVIVFSVGVYFLKIMLGQESYSIVGIFKVIIPNNWFVILYITLFLISPYINIVVNQLSVEATKKLLILLMILFSVWPTAVDVLSEVLGTQWVGLSSVGMYGSQWGYTITNFILMYVIGAFLRINGSFHNSLKLLGAVTVNSFLILVWANINDRTGFFTERSAWEYCNPLIIMNAVLLFCLFRNLKIKNNNIINGLSKGTFTVFLLQNTFIRQLNIEKYASGNTVMLIMHLLITSCIIYFLCWGIYYVYNKITIPIFTYVSKKIRFPEIDISK